MEYYDPRTHHFIADPETDPFGDGTPDFNDLEKASQPLILSASGWRKVFAADGDDESTATSISPADRVIAGAAALVLAEYLGSKTGDGRVVICTACDSRPTGPVLMDIMHRVFLALDAYIEPLFIAAAPEAMASVKLDERVDGFAYISASHNPIGHNGLKFGGADGAVFGGAQSAELIDRFRTVLADPDTIGRIVTLARSVSAARYSELLERIPACKQQSLQRYSAFTRRVVSGSFGPQHRKEADFFEALGRTLENHPVGILGELNGSARGASIDEEFLRWAGFIVEMHNDTPGDVVHRIVPEGESLDLCRFLLENARRENPAFSLGYVPDNDGDRGNIVYYSTVGKKAVPIDAQQVFALAVLAELAFQDYQEAETGADLKKAVVVNGPTSMRIERIASAFSAFVFRAEVGEANVVGLAEKLREKGYAVRILGEGSNGGNITHPATVRDPLNTLFSLVKLTAFQGPGSPYNFYDRWSRLSGTAAGDPSGFGLDEVIASLPSFITTSAYEPEAIMRIRTTDHARLKTNYEKIFLEEWEIRRDNLREEYGIHSWREINYEGIEAREGFGPSFRSGNEKGGLKIIFSDSSGEDTDFLWMRGSGTEPVFRVLADCAGRDRSRHDRLLEWHRDMINQADSH